MVQNFDRISLLVVLVLHAASTYEWNGICCNVLLNVPSKIIVQLLSCSGWSVAEGRI
jgi:hypothetical protein